MALVVAVDGNGEGAVDGYYQKVTIKPGGFYRDLRIAITTLFSSFGFSL